jgi:hypothetical protein
MVQEEINDRSDTSKDHLEQRTNEETLPSPDKRHRCHQDVSRLSVFVQVSFCFM